MNFELPEHPTVSGLALRSNPDSRKGQAVTQQISELQQCMNSTLFSLLLPEVVHTEPEIVEDEIKTMVPDGDRDIAVLKAYRSQDAALFRKIREELPQQTSVSDYLVRVVRLLLLSYANDVTTVRHIGEDRVIEHKISAQSTKEDVLAHLVETIGFGNQVSDYIRVEWRSTYALHEASTDISVARQKVHELLLYRASDSFLHALIFGLYDMRHPVDEHTRKRFLRLYEHGTEYSTPGFGEKPDRHIKNWSGWTPESGMPLEHLLNVNGARPGDSLPMVELLVASVNGLRPTQTGFDRAIKDAIKDVRGKGALLHDLLHTLLQTIAACQTLQEIASFSGTIGYTELAAHLREAQNRGEISSDWVYSGRTLLDESDPHAIDTAALESLVCGLLGLQNTSLVQ